MQSQNEYIGDEHFEKFLNHYGSKVPLSVVKMRFAGAICSPDENLRPTDVISSFFDEDKQPRLETKNEAELFFKFFMGLWDKIFEDVGFNHLKLSKLEGKDVQKNARTRYEELEFGFLEGFWAGQGNLKMPQYVAEVVDSLSELGNLYHVLLGRVQKGDDDEILLKTMQDTDRMVEKALSFLIENFVLPNIKAIGDKALMQ